MAAAETGLKPNQLVLLNDPPKQVVHNPQDDRGYFKVTAKDILFRVGCLPGSGDADMFGGDICGIHTTTAGCEADLGHHCAWVADRCEPDACMTPPQEPHLHLTVTPDVCATRRGCHWTGRFCVMDSCSRHEYRGPCDDEAHCQWDRDAEHSTVAQCEKDHFDRLGRASPVAPRRGNETSPSRAQQGRFLYFLGGVLQQQQHKGSQQQIQKGRAARRCVWSGELCQTDVCPYKESVDSCNDHGPTHGCVWRVGDNQCHRDSTQCARLHTKRDCANEGRRGGSGDQRW
eukprot:g13144.t1